MIAVALIIIMVSAPAAGMLLGILALIPRRSRLVGVAGFLLSLTIATYFLAMRFALFAG